MQPAVIVHLLPWEQAQARAYPIRFAVFVEEQGVPRELELDDKDPLSCHALAERAGLAIGTARLQQDGKIGRMAVLQAYRQQGVASTMMNDLLDFGQQQGTQQFYLHAQIAVLAFYERFGFKANGPVFHEAGIPHRRMVKIT